MHRPPPHYHVKTSVFVSLAASGNRWRKKTSSSSLLLLLLLPLLFLLLFFYPSSLSPRSHYLLFSSPVEGSLQTLEDDHFGASYCDGRGSDGDRRGFLLYAPHSGFSNQLSEFKNGLLFAAILNRTLVVPPVLDHHALVLGSCPKFRVTEPSQLRAQFWDHALHLLHTGRYVSMADIVNVSTLLSNGIVSTIDFRIFVSRLCGLKMKSPCFTQKAHPENLAQCRSLLSGMEGNTRTCVYPVQNDCRTTVWTYKQNDHETLDSFQPDEELRRKKKISYYRKRMDLEKAFGSGTDAERAVVLAFGTLFTAPYRGSESYIGINGLNTDPWIQSVFQKLEFLPFVREIVTAGKDYSKNVVREPYLCTQLRLLDGQFKNHWKATFAALRQRLESLQLERKQRNIGGPINIFIMTDLAPSNWTGTYLSDLQNDSNSFKIHFLRDNDRLVLRTANNVMAAQHSIGVSLKDNEVKGEVQACDFKLPDILLFLEETVCSCAALGFVGTSGSTIAHSIDLMIKNKFCFR